MENEESAQKYDNLLKLKNRLEIERDEAQHGMETMTRNIEMLTKSKVHNERQIKKLSEEKKENEKKIDELNDDMEKKDKELEDAENDMTEQKKAYSDLEYENQQTIRTLNALQQRFLYFSRTIIYSTFDIVKWILNKYAGVQILIQ